MAVVIDGESSWSVTASRVHMEKTDVSAVVFVRARDSALFAQSKDGQAKQAWIDLAQKKQLPLWIGTRKLGDETAPFLLGPESVTMFARLPNSIHFPEDEQRFAKRFFTRFSTKVPNTKVVGWFYMTESDTLAGVARWTPDEHGYTLNMHIFTDSFEKEEWTNGLPINQCVDNRDVGKLSLTLDEVVRITKEVLLEEFYFDIEELEEEGLREAVFSLKGYVESDRRKA